MRKIAEISAIVLLLSLSRLAITIPNLETIGAAALFGGALLSSKYLRFIIPLVALFIGDLILSAILPVNAGYVFGPTFFATYAAFALTVVIGRKLIGSQPKMKNVLVGSVASSLLFFVITNFASWADPAFSMYTKDLSGLMTCYAMGIPFYKMTFVSNVLVSVAIFGLYGVYQKQFASKTLEA